jgi:peptidoglycan/xylan/chitin deacetylase (PgdA/CDA1 family)
MPRISLDRIAKFIPFPYHLVPATLRNRLSFLVSLPDESEVQLQRTALRYSGPKTPVLLTHDVDTGWGYRRGIGIIREIERKHDYRSTFFLVAKSKQYQLRSDDLRSLIDEGCEIGSHELYHDGRICLLDHDQRLQRIRESKLILESLLQARLAGFRLPWMTYFPELFEMLEVSGYVFDMSLFGIDTIFPFMPEGHTIVEFPLTVPSDYYLLNRRRLRDPDFLNTWKSRIIFLHANRGVVVLVAHPDRYDLGGRPHLYEQLLEYLHAHEDKYEVTTPSDIMSRLTATDIDNSR